MDDPIAQNPSAQLLRIAGTMLLHLDPVKGMKASAAQTVVEELREVEETVVGLIPSVHLDCIGKAIYTLEGGTPHAYKHALLAHSYLFDALVLLAGPSADAPRSSLSLIARLPAELVAHVVSFVQEEQDHLLRQRTNAFLARSNRELNKLVQPILQTEVAIGTARQLERFAAKVKRAKKGELSVKRVWVDLDLDEVSRRDDRSWAGRRFLPTFTRLLKLVDLDLLHVNFRSDDGWELDDDRKYRTTFGFDVDYALGLDDEGWWTFASSYLTSTFPNVVDLRLPNMSTSSPAVAPYVQEVFMPPPALRRLQLGCGSPPSVSPPDRVADAFEAYEERFQQPQEGVTRLGFRYEVLAIPYHTCYPRHLLPLLRPPPPLLLPTIYHLEASIRLDNLHRDLAELCNAISGLSPSLRRLAFRIEYRHTSVDDMTLFTRRFGPMLANCKHLEHLEIGGDLLHPTLLYHLNLLRDLHHLVLLSHGDDFDQNEFIEAIGVLPPPLATLVLYLPGEQAKHDLWKEHDLRQAMEVCEEAEIEFKAEERPEEFAWLAADKGA